MDLALTDYEHNNPGKGHALKGFSCSCDCDECDECE